MRVAAPFASFERISHAHPGVGVDANDDLVGFGVLRRIQEGEPRRTLEDESNFGHLDGKFLARADEKRHARPTPVVDAQPQGDEGLGIGTFLHSRDPLIAVVLTSHALARLDARDRTKHVDLLVPQRASVPL